MTPLLRKPVSTALIALLGLVSASAQAALVERDFASANDGLLIFDSLSNREWVDVTHTTSMSVNQFLTTSIYAGKGFHLGTTADITQFFLNAGASAVNANGNLNPVSASYAAAVLLNDLMEHQSPWLDSSGNPWVHGYEDYGNGTSLTIARFVVGEAIGRPTGTATFDTGTNGTGWSRDTTHGAVGIFAWRDAAGQVPEPASLALVSIALLGAFSVGRKRAPR